MGTAYTEWLERTIAENNIKIKALREIVNAASNLVKHGTVDTELAIKLNHAARFYLDHSE